ncbi:hypothetical protein Xinn_03685 [Xenorhabdus innexi]|uniref:A-factor biosynthesis hotdog domain-containing protein n=4 Tax=Xenorhabdus innexi TaxID=290109 RepID=A0A2G0N3X7_9GAMM|nr:hypothetical protein Xinn_03685 [Xenorhabdus innexi]
MLYGGSNLASAADLRSGEIRVIFFSISVVNEGDNYADREGLSHKHNEVNTLISKPSKITDDIYELDMLIDEGCHLMLDHQTGKHVQGMILMEAARQSFLAVSEEFFIQEEATPRYFVINEMKAAYKRFVFPIPAIIKYKIIDKNTSNADKMSFTAEMELYQSGLCAATFFVKFTIFPAARISEREGKLAEEAVDSFMQIQAANYGDMTLPQVG